jgi:ubiquinone/menaquinone biosynthesis C-methylase UbiE
MDIVQQTIRTYDTIAHEYCRKTRQRLDILEWEEEYIQRLLSHISVSDPLILDVGCADGRHCLLIEKNGGTAIGIDLSEGMLKEARAYYPDCEYRNMDMRSLLFDDSFFDGIWVSGSVYHVAKSDVRGVIDEFAKALKPDGVVAVNFKLGKGEGLEENPKSYSGSPRYFAYYTEQEMKDMFEGSGFQVLESCRFPEEIFEATISQMWFRLQGT